MTGHLASYSLVGLAVLAALGCSSAPPQAPVEVPSVSFGKRGEARSFAEICRYEVATLPPALSIFAHTRNLGGLTCFQNGQGVVFIPRREAACPRLTGVATTAPRIISQIEATSEYLGCSAIALPPSSGSSQLTIYRLSPDHPEGEDRFLDFVLDAGALVSNDMLPVTLFLQEGGVLCLESSDARRTANRIAEAEIANPDEMIVELGEGSCRAQDQNPD